MYRARYESKSPKNDVEANSSFITLFGLCKINNPSKVIEFLRLNKVNVLDHDGILLREAAKEGNIVLLKIIIDYYVKTELTGDNYFEGSDKYLSKLEELKAVIRAIASNLENKLSKEAIELFEPFLEEGDDGSDLDSTFEGVDDARTELGDTPNHLDSDNTPKAENDILGVTRILFISDC